MTEHDAALAFDQALDGTYRHELNGAEPMLETAHTLQTLFDRQHAIPSEEFVMQLERSLFPASVIPSAVEGPPAATVSCPQPMARPARIAPDIHRLSRSRLIAIAAALVLLIGGMSAYFGGPLEPRSDPEPSAIPAASFGSAEASPEAVGRTWTVAPPEGADHADRPGIVSDGLMFSVFAGGGASGFVQAVDLQAGHALWSGPLRSWPAVVLSAAGGLLLVAGSDGGANELTAFDGRSGNERWTIDLEQRPVGLLVVDDLIVVLESGNQLKAFDLHSQELRWQADLSQFDAAAKDDGGQNQYFNVIGSRIAATDGVLGVIASNGRLIGVDAGDGAVLWANDRTTNSLTLVSVVKGALVVTAAGSDTPDYHYDTAATPSPEIDRCQTVIAPRSGLVPEPIDPGSQAVDSFVPQTGESPWGVVSSLPAWIWPLDDSNLIAQVSPGWDVVNDQPQDLFSCRIDGVTGTVSDLDSDSLVDVVFDINSEDLAGLAAFANGGSFPIMNVDPTVAASLPKVDSTSLPPGTGAMAQIVNGLIVVTWSDGTLIGLPKNAPSWPSAEATVAVATPEPGEVIWTTSGPEGVGPEWHEPAFADGRVFRSFRNLVGDDHVQAVDTESGAVLWQKQIDIGTTAMMARDDLLLIVGQDKSEMGSNSLVLALEPATGDEVWRVSSDQSAVSMAVTDDRVLVLGSNNQLDAFDLLTGQGIYSSDIGGDSRPSSEIITLPDGMVRMGLTVVGDTVIAVLADTSLAGVDIETGTGLWWRLRVALGDVSVSSVDGSLVVLDAGDLEAILEYESAIGITSPDATPVVTQDFARAPCFDSDVSATPLVDEDGKPLPPVPKAVMGLEPSTGDVLWTVHSAYLEPTLIAIDSALLYQAAVREEWPYIPAQSTLCSLDPENGEAVEVKSLDEVAQVTFIAALASTPDLLLRAAIVNGELIMMLDALDPTTTKPDVVIDDVTDGVIRWIEVHDGALYIATDNSDLKKVQLPHA
jgi:outer membrane protein assembly factor BamB